jgi:pimeloyl-ACP methyl ester carboxylesterase
MTPEILPYVVGGLVFLFFTLFILAVLFLGKKNDFSSSPLLTAEDSPLSSFMEFSWGKVWTYDSGPESPHNTPPVVFLHGMGASIYSWRFQIAEFKHHHRALALDLLGYGQSDKQIQAGYDLDSQTERVMDFIRAKGITSCYLVGCSMGGAFSLWLSYLYPEVFKKVAVLAPAAVPQLVPLSKIDLALLAPVAKRLVSPRTIRLFLEHGLAKHATILDEEMVNTYYSPYQDPNAVICFLKSATALKDPRIFNALAKRTTPTLLLWGKNDRVVRRSIIQKIQNQAPETILITHPTGGHHLMEDEPDWVNEQIRNFFDSPKV